MSVQKQYKRGTAVRIDATVRTVADVLVDPTSITITIKDSAGATLVNAANMTKDVTGRYYYVYQSAVDAVIGLCDVEITAVYESKTVIRQSLEQFELVT